MLATAAHKNSLRRLPTNEEPLRRRQGGEGEEKPYLVCLYRYESVFGLLLNHARVRTKGVTYKPTQKTRESLGCTVTWSWRKTIVSIHHERADKGCRRGTEGMEEGRGEIIPVSSRIPSCWCRPLAPHSTSGDPRAACLHLTSAQRRADKEKKKRKGELKELCTEILNAPASDVLHSPEVEGQREHAHDED